MTDPLGQHLIPLAQITPERDRCNQNKNNRTPGRKGLSTS